MLDGQVELGGYSTSIPQLGLNNRSGGRRAPKAPDPSKFPRNPVEIKSIMLVTIASTTYHKGGNIQEN